jgi:hypothetical protein
MMRKYQSVEKAEVLPEKERAVISSTLNGMSKTAAHELTDEEREELMARLDKARP